MSRSFSQWSIQSLIGPETIATIPPATLRAFEDHGTIERTLCEVHGDAVEVMKALADGGIDFAAVNRTLENEGIQKFTAALENVLRVLAGKRATLIGGGAGGGGSSPITSG
jgi:transaldolase